MYESFNDLKGDMQPTYHDENITQYKEDENKANKWSKMMNIFAFTILLITMGFVMYIGVSNTPRNLSSLLRQSADMDIKIIGSDPVYGSNADLMNYLPWDALIEPNKAQILSIQSFTLGNSVIDTTDSAYTFVWSINGAQYYGTSVTVTVTSTGTTSVTVSVSYSKGPTKPLSKIFTVGVKYIRREIRSLTDDDRNTFLNALQTLYTTSTVDGQAKYGSKYKSAEDFLLKHLNGAAKVDCDHWHDGAGIVTHHAAISLELEQSLQAINPTIALPYWEYGKDYQLYDYWWQSPIFNDDWFGEASPSTADHSLRSGRWAGLKFPDGSSYKSNWDISSSKSLNPFVNGQGHLRSPWNNNPSQVLSRCNRTYGADETVMPKCDEINSCFKSASLADMSNCLNGVTHGPVHVLIGGTWSSKADDTTLLTSIDRVLLFKLLWRTGYTRCPESCDGSSICSCAVPEEYIKTYGIEQILRNSQVYDLIYNKMPLDTLDDLQDALEAVEDPGIAGDMFSSAASYDPTFWPLHGQIERILGLKRIQLSQGIINSDNFDETWGFSVTDDRYLQGYCDWSSVKGASDITLPTCEFTSTESCEGHNANDVMEFSNFLGQGESYTNTDFYTFSHPWNDDLPYVYDTYGFDYCEDEGYVFN